MFPFILTLLVYLPKWDAPEVFKAANAKLQVEVDSLKKQLHEYHQTAQIQINCTSSENAKVAFLEPKRQKTLTVSNRIKSELAKVGVDLNTTLAETIKSTSEELVISAIEALKEAINTRAIERPGGWLNKAIKDGWKPNEKHLPQDKVTRDILKEWFELAYKQKLVLASTKGADGQIYIYTLDGVSVPFEQMLAKYPLERLKPSLWKA